MSLLNSLRDRQRQSRNKSSRRRKAAHYRSPRRLQTESLEARQVMTGVVLGVSTFDPQIFGDNMSSMLDFNTVGYAYAVNHDGQAVAASGTGGIYGTNNGLSRTDADMPFPFASQTFDVDTRTEIASVSKIITTAAVLKLLESTTGDLDTALDTPISTYLPSDWVMGPNVNLITIRHLLTHTSGFQEGGPNDPANLIGVNFESFGNNTFANLRALVAAGHPNASNPPTQTHPNGNASWARTYSNANFSLLAKMIPYMRPDVSNAYLDQVSDPNDGNFDGANPDAIFGTLYESYVRNNVLTPAGIVNASLSPSGIFPAVGYNLATTLATNEPTSGYNQSSMTNTGGAFGWKLSAPELARFLDAIEHNNAVLSPTARALMNDEDFVLGWAPNVSGSNPVQLSPTQDAFGNYYSHGGAAGNSVGDFRSQVVVFPGDIEASLVLNDDAAALPQSRFNVMKESYINAWTDLTVEGSAGSDDFVLSMNPSAAVPSLDLFINGVLQFTHYIDTFDSLTLWGLAGDDTFTINALPSTMSLTVLGQGGNDSIFFGNGDVDTNTRGNATFVGGAGSNSVLYNDASDVGADSYVVTSTSISKPTSPGTFQYWIVDNLELRANNASNNIAIKSNTDATMSILAGGGNDVITVGNGDISGNLNRSITVDGQSGTDQLVLDDRNGNLAEDFYVIEQDYFTKNGYGGLISNLGTERIRLRGTDNDSTTNVRGTKAGQRVQIDGNDGEDLIRIHETGAGSQVVVYAGANNDTVEVSPDDRDLDNIGGRIWANLGAGNDDTLYIRDDNDVGNDAYVMSATRFDKTNFDRIDYFNVDDLRVFANDANNMISVYGIAATTDLTVRAGDGNDTVRVGAGDLDNHLLGDLALWGEGGQNSLMFRDGLDATDDTLYELTSSTFTKTGIDHWTYSAFEDVELRAGSGDNTIDISSFGSLFTDGQLTVRAGAGNDEVVVGEGFGRVDFINDDVQIFGGTGSDTVTVDETNAQSSRQYVLQGNTFDIDNTALFAELTTMSDVEDFVVLAGAHNDHFDVRSTLANTDVELRGNAGNDTVDVASVSHDLDSIGGTLRFLGGALIGGGVDTITLFDDADLGDDDYVLSTSGLFGSGEVTKTGFHLDHSGTELITLNANSGDNTIEISGTNSIFNPDYVINAGAGDDDVVVNTPPFSELTIHGDTGDDLVAVIATGQDETAVVEGNTIEVGTTTIHTDSTVEHRSLDLGDGDDLVEVQGVAAVDELFRIEAWGTPGAGVLSPGKFSPIQFSHVEDIDVQGNANDEDNLIFEATERDDVIAISLAAEGTAAQPVLTLNDGQGTTRLRLRNYTDVGTPMVDSRDGADTVRVTVAPQRGAVVRDIRLNGGPLSGKEGGDTLMVSHNGNVTDASNIEKNHLQYKYGAEAYDIYFADFESIFV
ncbi:MAG: serine hydrolase domain-containing protein [Pirellulaceae bacterium]